MYFATLLIAQADTPGGPSGTPQQPGMMMQLMPLVFIMVIFYFLLIRPQQKRQKDHLKLVASLQTGDRVVTNGGIHGLIANVKDKTFIVKIADNVKIEVDKGSITAVTPSES